MSAAKIIPPCLPAILPRPRLLQRLHQNQGKKLILILGAAAQGKTTLAASYLEQSPFPSAWLNLGPEDSEAVNLFYLLVQSLHRALPEGDLAQMLFYPSLPAGPREENLLYHDWLITLLSQIPSAVQVVFDGLDRLAPQASAFPFLQVLLDVAPPHLHLLILSREMPPLKIHEMKMRQQLHIIRNEDLGFTLKETKNFLCNVRRLSLPNDLMGQLHEVTEGWIGSLVLLSETLERLREEHRENFLYREVSEKFMEEVSGYFDEIIFSSRPKPIQEFLMKSSILDIVDPEFLKDFLDMDQTRDTLEDLSQKNLFVQPVFDKQRGWLYRYHQLFQDFLQTKFKGTLTAAQQASTYLQIGSSLEERGDWERSVDFYLQAKDLEQAIASIERVGYDLLERSQTAKLAGWLQSLPPTLVQDHPWLLFYRYMTERFTGAMNSIAHLQRALSLFRQQLDTRGLLLASAYFLDASHYFVLDEPLTTQVERAEELLSNDNLQLFPYECAVLMFYLGWGQLYGPNPRAGSRNCQKAALLARDAGKPSLQINALIRCHLILSCLGEFAQAEEISRQVDELLATWTSPELQVMQLLISAQLLLFKGELDKGQALVESCRKLIEKHGLIFLYPISQIYYLFSLTYQGRYEEARQIGQKLAELLPSMGGIVAGLALMNLATMLYHQGNLVEARQYVEKGLKFFSSDLSGSYFHLSLLKVCLALISYHQGAREPEAEQGLQEALEYGTEAAVYLLLPDVHWALALWRQHQNLYQEAAAHLQAGMKIAARRDSYFSLILSPQDQGRIFTLALELEVDPGWERLLPTLVKLSEWIRPDLERLSRHANPKIAAQARDIRLALHRAGIPRLRIRTLGGFQLVCGDTLVDQGEWDRQKSVLLLKALLAYGARDLPRDVLMEALWAGTSQEIAENNFKVFLHRLRKNLEPDMDKTYGSSYLHLKGRLLSLDQELCQVDVDEFLSLVGQGERLEQKEHYQEALAFYKQALEIYRGDFLAEELYQPWAATRREELRRRHLDLLLRVAAIYERRGAARLAIDVYRQVIQIDPLAEEAHQKLMLLYINRGKRNDALRVYNDLHKTLQQELHSEPDRVTQAIHKKILDSQ